MTSILESVMQQGDQIAASRYYNDAANATGLFFTDIYEDLGDDDRWTLLRELIEADAPPIDALSFRQHTILLTVPTIKSDIRSYVIAALRTKWGERLAAAA